MLLKKLPFICAALPLTLSALACGETADDPPAEVESYERPAGSVDLVSDAELAEFAEAGVDINGGLTPPDVAGTYLFDDGETTYSSSDIYPAGIGEGEGCDYEETFAAGANDDEILVSSEGLQCELSADATDNFISGDEGCFTLYGELTGTFEGCDFTALRVFSACLDDETGDLIDPMLAEQMRESEGESCAGFIEAGTFPDDGVLYVVEQVDGRATRVEADPIVDETGDGSM